MIFATLAVFYSFTLCRISKSVNFSSAIHLSSLRISCRQIKFFWYFTPSLLFRATPRHSPIQHPTLFNRLSIRHLTHCHGQALQRRQSQGHLCLASSLLGNHLLGQYLVGPMKIFSKACLQLIQSSS